jgi:hypothetical protein
LALSGLGCPHHRTFNHGVAGSSPAGLATLKILENT